VARIKILVAEDEAGVRFGLKDFLESSGCGLEEADSSQAAVEIFQPARPDAAIEEDLSAVNRISAHGRPPLAHGGGCCVADSL